MWNYRNKKRRIQIRHVVRHVDVGSSWIDSFQAFCDHSHAGKPGAVESGPHRHLVEEVDIPHNQCPRNSDEGSEDQRHHPKREHCDSAYQGRASPDFSSSPASQAARRARCCGEILSTSLSANSTSSRLPNFQDSCRKRPADLTSRLITSPGRSSENRSSTSSLGG